MPDTFGVLLSQRRRWINSTVHNLFELFIVPDLCGVFCFSMRFVVFMELVGTLVLPAAISFTIYLVIVAIIPGTTKPVLSLILLAIILGLPGILIVVTTRRMAYIGWMLIYLLCVNLFALELTWRQVLTLIASARFQFGISCCRPMLSCTWTTSHGAKRDKSLASSRAEDTARRKANSTRPTLS